MHFLRYKAQGATVFHFKSEKDKYESSINKNMDNKINIREKITESKKEMSTYLKIYPEPSTKDYSLSRER